MFTTIWPFILPWTCFGRITKRFRFVMRRNSSDTSDQEVLRVWGVELSRSVNHALGKVYRGRHESRRGILEHNVVKRIVGNQAFCQCCFKQCLVAANKDDG